MFRDDPGEHLEFHRSPALPGVELLSAWHSTQPWHVFHVQYAICACRMAATGIRYRGRMEPIGDRSVCLFEPGESHRNSRVHKASDFKVLFIDPDTCRDAAQEVGLRGVPHFDLLPRSQEALFEFAYRLSQGLESATSPLEIQSRYSAFMVSLLACAGDRCQPPRVIVANAALERVRRYIVERFDQPITLPELAAMSGVSRFHLVREFTRQFGLPPHAFQIHVRVERARQLLRRRHSPVDVAAEVGFADQSHFTRHFRRIWRVTPAAYSRLC